MFLFERCFKPEARRISNCIKREVWRLPARVRSAHTSTPPPFRPAMISASLNLFLAHCSAPFKLSKSYLILGQFLGSRSKHLIADSRKLMANGQRNLTPALPFCHAVLRGRKPIDFRYPSEIRTIGDRLRAARLSLGLHQREVADRLGVCEDSVCYWENSRVQPSRNMAPRIRNFLRSIGNPERNSSQQVARACESASPMFVSCPLPPNDSSLTLLANALNPTPEKQGATSEAAPLREQ